MSLLNFGNFDDGGPLEQEFGYVQNAALFTSGFTRLRTTAAMDGDFQNGVYEGFASTDRTGIKGVWANYTVAGSGDSAVIEVWQGNPFLRVRPSGADLEVWTVNGDVVATATNALPSISSSTYYKTELKWTVSTLDTGNTLNADGSFELRVDGASVASASNIELGFPLQSGLTRDVYWNVVVFNPHGDGTLHYLCNGAGSRNTDFMPANVAVYTQRPASDGSFSQLTCSTGTSQSVLVDDTTSDDDATYLYGTGAALASSFNFTDFSSIGSQIIYGLRHVAIGRKTEAGFRRFRSFVYRNALQQFATTDFPVGTGHFAWLQMIHEIDPHTNAKWTVANINASEFGVLIG